MDTRPRRRRRLRAGPCGARRHDQHGGPRQGRCDPSSLAQRHAVVGVGEPGRGDARGTDHRGGFAARAHRCLGARWRWTALATAIRRFAMAPVAHERRQPAGWARVGAGGRRARRPRRHRGAGRRWPGMASKLEREPQRVAACPARLGLVRARTAHRIGTGDFDFRRPGAFLAAQCRQRHGHPASPGRRWSARTIRRRGRRTARNVGIGGAALGVADASTARARHPGGRRHLLSRMGRNSAAAAGRRRA